MNKENRCFFSISLENGITITGAKPYEVRDFLRTCYIASTYAVDVCKEENLPLSKKHYDKFSADILDAIVTINDNLKN